LKIPINIDLIQKKIGACETTRCYICVYVGQDHQRLYAENREEKQLLLFFSLSSFLLLSSYRLSIEKKEEKKEEGSMYFDRE